MKEIALWVYSGTKKKKKKKYLLGKLENLKEKKIDF